MAVSNTLPSRRPATAAAVARSTGYAQGWADAKAGRWSPEFEHMVSYVHGRQAAVLATIAGNRVQAPGRSNTAKHAAILQAGALSCDLVMNSAVVAKRIACFLQELCGTIPPHKPGEMLSFKRSRALRGAGLPYVPTYAELHAVAPAAVPVTRRHKVPS